jgi:hypothetical protein
MTEFEKEGEQYRITDSYNGISVTGSLDKRTDTINVNLSLIKDGEDYGWINYGTQVDGDVNYSFRCKPNNVDSILDYIKQFVDEVSNFID